jgi:hypothetical protein
VGSIVAATTLPAPADAALVAWVVGAGRRARLADRERRRGWVTNMVKDASNGLVDQAAHTVRAHTPTVRQLI